MPRCARRWSALVSSGISSGAGVATNIGSVKLRIFLVMVVLSCGGCRRAVPVRTDVAGQEKFAVRGVVVGVDAARGEVMLKHEAIAGFMGAMTMPYKLKDRGVIGELHPGDKIVAKMLVEHGGFGYRNARLDEIVVTEQAQADYVPAVQYHVPVVGDAVPNFALRNQSGRVVRVADFKGKALLITFIYTRCPLGDFCPKMSRNFAEIEKALKADAGMYARTHLLSVSFDPAYDSPAVLRSYGGAYTGEYTNEKFAHWEFAAPAAKDLPGMLQFFDVGMTPGESGTLNHSLSTALVGPDGRIVAWWAGNEWTPAEVLGKMREVVGR